MKMSDEAQVAAEDLYHAAIVLIRYKDTMKNDHLWHNLANVANRFEAARQAEIIDGFSKARRDGEETPSRRVPWQETAPK